MVKKNKKNSNKLIQCQVLIHSIEFESAEVKKLTFDPSFPFCLGGRWKRQYITSRVEWLERLTWREMG